MRTNCVRVCWLFSFVWVQSKHTLFGAQSVNTRYSPQIICVRTSPRFAVVIINLIYVRFSNSIVVGSSPGECQLVECCPFVVRFWTKSIEDFRMQTRRNSKEQAIQLRKREKGHNARARPSKSAAQYLCFIEGKKKLRQRLSIWCSKMVARPSIYLFYYADRNQLGLHHSQHAQTHTTIKSIVLSSPTLIYGW